MSLEVGLGLRFALFQLMMCCPTVGEGPLREMLEGVRSYLFSPTSRYFAAAPSNLAFHIRADGPVDEQSLR